MRRALLTLLLPATLAACGNDAPRPAPKPAAAAPAAPKPAETAAATPAASGDAAPAFVYAYIPSGKRDPFRNPLDELSANDRNGAVIQTACNAPLCKWDLDQLKLVGVVSGMSNPLAMVEDPQGVGYLVRRNSFMGKKGGRVTQIKHDSLVVTEIVRGGDGKPHPNDIPLHLALEQVSAGDQDLLENEGGE
ncbi:MAG: pilus assembly protein PilP [Deltaproteobacteria bacterium]|nr:pilus assembly protein PilP [Deltaproteobacteria bacterium]